MPDSWTGWPPRRRHLLPAPPWRDEAGFITSQDDQGRVAAEHEQERWQDKPEQQA